MPRWLILLFWLLAACQSAEPVTTQPTLTRSPSLTRTVTATSTRTPTPSVTTSPTRTATSSSTPTPSLTPTLEEPVLHITAVMDGAILPVDEIPQQPTVPSPSDPLPNVTFSAPPFYDWVTYESDHPALQYSGNWQSILSQQASRGQYHYSVDPAAAVKLPFSGTAVRVRYVAFTNGGQWEIRIDGQVVATIEGYSPTPVFGVTEIFTVQDGDHVLSIHSLGHSHPDSTDLMVAIDAVDIYRPRPDSVQSIPITPTTTPKPAQSIQIVQSAPTLPPTATPQPPALVEVSLIIAYDENANGSVDPAEGVRGIPVRLVEVGTNQVLSDSVTDMSGLAALQAVSNSPLRLVVPYFGAVWDVRVNSERQSFTLLLPPGNQPGLIP